MPRSTSSRRGKSTRRAAAAAGNQDAANDNNNNNPREVPAPAAAAGGGRVLPEHVRARQRAIAEREAARLARPERRATATLGHADRKKSAVTSTPFGFMATTLRNTAANSDETTTTWCGPFTVARQMIAAREQAKRQREEDLENNENNTNSAENHPLDAAMAEMEEENRRKAHPSLLWKSRAALVTPEPKSKKARLPTRSNDNSAINNKKVKSLYQLCVDFVVDNFDHVESLGQVDHAIRTSIAHALAGQNRLDRAALEALVEPQMEALELIDCADIPQEALVAAIHKSPTALRYLVLDQAGRCFGRLAVETLLNPFVRHAPTLKPVPLFAMHIGGAYLLQDADASKLIAAVAPTLQSLAWKACPLLGVEMCKSIPANYTTTQNTLLEFSLEDMTLSRECWDALVDKNASDSDDAAAKWQRNLKSLTLRRVAGLQDDIVVSLLQGAPELEHLDLSDNHELTDASLAPLRNHPTSSLRSLHLYNLKQLTSIGLETLFTHGLESMGPPPQLKVLNLSHLDVEAVTDQVMELVLQCASCKPSDIAATTPTPSSGLSLLGGMIRLELQGAAITDTTLERIAATSANTLEHLNVSFCSQISDQGLGYLVDNIGNQLEEVQIWGCAQITEQFWNGHARVVENNTTSDAIVPLQITGAWMKKSGISSIRS